MTGWDDNTPPAADDWATEPPVAALAPQEPNLVRLDAHPEPRAVRDALLALESPNTARIDASAVERLPGSVLQVLLVAMQDAVRTGARLAVLNPSFAFSLAFEAYGLGGENEPFNVEYS